MGGGENKWKEKKKDKYEYSSKRLKAHRRADDIQPKCGIGQASNVVNEDGVGDLGGSECMDLVRLT